MSTASHERVWINHVGWTKEIDTAIRAMPDVPMPQVSYDQRTRRGSVGWMRWLNLRTREVSWRPHSTRQVSVMTQELLDEDTLDRHVAGFVSHIDPVHIGWLPDSIDLSKERRSQGISND